VSPGFFDVTGQRLLQGRPFADDDLDSKQPVAVVNAAFAAQTTTGPTTRSAAASAPP
jgi:hypothetical protein